jgi:hypothetical protein
VRVRYLASAFLYGNSAMVDYWFYAGDRLLVLTYMSGSYTDSFPTYGNADLETIAQSVRLLE